MQCTPLSVKLRIKFIRVRPRYKLKMDEKVIQAGMFNNRSTGSERHNLLKSILRADDMEEEEENEAPDDETINQMIAR